MIRWGCAISVAFGVAALAAGPEAPSAPAAGGVIAGKVRVTATLTKRRVTVPQVYDRTAAIASPAAEGPDVATELKRVVLYLDTRSLPANPIRVTMNQKQRRFEPEVVAVPVGSTVSFPNNDPIFHNVFSLSKAKPIDLGNYKSGETRLVTFTQPGAVQLHCHLHPNMSGAVLVTPNDFWQQPAADGTFALPPVPPGRYTLTAWHKSAGFFYRTVDIRAGQRVQVDFEIPLTNGGPGSGPHGSQ